MHIAADSNQPPADYDNEISGTEAGEQLLGTTASDLLKALGGNDQVYGFSGNDRLEGGAGNDRLQGGNGSNSGSGDDTLIGGAGDDVLVGEDGNDVLDGGSGSDHFYYYAGTGQDVIHDSANGQDILFFVDVAPERLSYHQDGQDLIVLVDSDLAQQVRVKNHFNGGDNEIMVQPNGGYTQTAAAINNQLTALPSSGNTGGGNDNGGGTDDGGTDGSNPDQGSDDTNTIDLSGDNDLVGTSVNDVVVAGDGADTLSGLAGDDVLIGGEGDDTYIIGANTNADRVIDVAGQNTIRFVDGIGFNDVASGLVKSGNDLILKIAGGPSQVKISSFFSIANTIEQIVFETGGSLSAAQLFGAFGLAAPSASSQSSTVALGDGLANTLEGSNGADVLITGRGDDTLSGLEGDDLLVGGEGDDVYLIGSNSGTDILIDTQGTNIIRFVDGIGFNDVASGLMKSGDDLVLNINGGASVAVNGFFKQTNTISKLEFATGGELSAAQLFGAFGLAAPTASLVTNDILSDVITGTAAADTITGTSANDKISAGSGDDSVHGGAGDDVIIGGKGNDVVDGGAGSDTLIFNEGDGSDVVNQLDSDTNSNDVLVFNSTVSLEELWFSQDGNNLNINIAGTDDQVTVTDWYGGENHQFDEVKFGNSVLLNNQVDQLVAAMSVFDVPLGAGAIVTQDAKDALQPVITSVWQAA